MTEYDIHLGQRGTETTGGGLRESDLLCRLWMIKSTGTLWSERSLSLQRREARRGHFQRAPFIQTSIELSRMQGTVLSPGFQKNHLAL